MIVSFSGDPFLVRRSARAFLAGEGFAPADITELSEDVTADAVAQAAMQSGLFGRQALLLDFDAAFVGQGGVKPRNEIMRALEKLPADASVVVLDSDATASRKKAFEALGSHHHQPTPRYGALASWVGDELERQGVRAERDVAATLADLFGEDLPAIAAEIQKLTVLDETLTSVRVREIANRPAARDAFDLIDAAVAGDAGTALDACRTLLEQGEAPPRVMGALVWQLNLVAGCVGLQESGAANPGGAARRLKASPYAVRKALAIAMHLDETAVFRALDTLLAADVAMKSGRDASTALELCTLELTRVFAH